MLDARHGWKRDGLIAAGDVLESLRTHFTPAPSRTRLAASPPSLCPAFSRDRARLTVDGQTRTCVFAQEASDLRGALLTAAPDVETAELWKHAVWRKEGRLRLDEPSCRQPAGRCRPSSDAPGFG